MNIQFMINSQTNHGSPVAHRGVFDVRHEKCSFTSPEESIKEATAGFRSAGTLRAKSYTRCR